MDEYLQIKHIFIFGITFSVHQNLYNLYKLDSKLVLEYTQTC